MRQTQLQDEPTDMAADHGLLRESCWKLCGRTEDEVRSEPYP